MNGFRRIGRKLFQLFLYVKYLKEKYNNSRKGAFMIKVLVVFFMVVFLSGCDLFQKNFLDIAEDHGEEKQSCLVNQVLKNDCDSINKKLKILDLELEKSENPPEKKKVRAAYKLGKLKVTGDPEKSIYNQVRNSLKGFPSQMGYPPLELNDTNFLMFTGDCYKLSKNNWQRFTNRYKYGKTIILFLKLEGNCFDISDLQGVFSILTEEQVDKLNSENIKILKFESYEEANAASEKFEN